ncbi:unnamed protein product (macronuclear) [Paramecium tetraurelia]|uniref:Poly(A) RNA polymerase mitochondrial-like central palm domain-containing protein n=1 Tax=Paramecium tetraurelia TaxID=5888 RepID=A0BXL4_PARTE|nr:uncharacterized protein GSPATT00033134001 [Paramecium tetraurelia]CAK63281.1 unnamed protein product [Paramecium tetraurelia]|eukprot:XP_001430679.1 hypothetical protein (macronuclear) [Paramecium tetraurelia strain d4-2]
MSEETKEKIMKSIERFVKLLKQVKYQSLNPPLSKLYHTYFGSLLNGFGTQSSDVDYTILTNSYVNEKQFLQFTKQEIEKIIKSNKNYSRFVIERYVDSARIPVINIKDTVENVEFDLCVNNILGVINTKLLNQYASLHENVRIGGVLLKVWGKAQKLINHNDFSSYQIILMWIAFLQREHMLPVLQDKELLRQTNDQSGKLEIARAKSGDEASSPTDHFTTDVSFLTDPEIIKQKMEQCTVGCYKISELLRDFWKFYQFPDGKFFKDEYLISIHQPNKDLQKKWATNLKFLTKDPFDISHDPGQRAKNIEERRLEIFEKSKIIMQKQLLQQVKEIFSQQ